LTRPGGHAFNPNPDKFTDQVTMSDIYGRHEAVRLTKRKGM
jgi:hypothetical protein